MYAIELDFCDDDLPSVGEPDEQARTEAIVGAWVREYVGAPVAWRVVDLHGPAGLLPVVRFEADTRTAIERVVEAYAPMDATDSYDQAYLMTLIDELPGNPLYNVSQA